MMVTSGHTHGDYGVSLRRLAEAVMVSSIYSLRDRNSSRPVNLRSFVRRTPGSCYLYSRLQSIGAASDEHEPVPPQENSDSMTDRIIPYGLRGEKLAALGALEASRRALPNFRFSRRHVATWPGACLVHGRGMYGVDKSKIDRAERDRGFLLSSFCFLSS